jgi:hypothetical protein
VGFGSPDSGVQTNRDAIQYNEMGVALRHHFDFGAIIPYPAAEARLAEFKWPWAKWRSKVAAQAGDEGPFIKAAMEAVGITPGGGVAFGSPGPSAAVRVSERPAIV